jgi:hypothetical protein
MREMEVSGCPLDHELQAGTDAVKRPRGVPYGGADARVTRPCRVSIEIPPRGDKCPRREAHSEARRRWFAPPAAAGPSTIVGVTLGRLENSIHMLLGGDELHFLPHGILGRQPRLPRPVGPCLPSRLGRFLSLLGSLHVARSVAEGQGSKMIWDNGCTSQIVGIRLLRLGGPGRWPLL